MRALLFLLISTGAFSQTTAPTTKDLKTNVPRPEKAAASILGATGNRPVPNEGAEKSLPGTETSPVFVKVLPPSNTPGGTDKGKSDWWVTAFTGVLAGAAIIQLLVYLKQTRYMRDSLAATTRAANAAALGASVAELALKLAQRADVLLNAASIIDLNGRSGVGVAHDTRVMLEFKNFGTTRAEEVLVEVTLEIPTVPVGRNSLGPVIMGPGDTQNVSFGVFGDHLTERTAIDMNSGKLPMRFQGTVSYKDVFGERHTAACGGEFDTRTQRFRVDGSKAG